MERKSHPSPGLAEMHRLDAERGVDPLAPSRVVTVGPKPVPPRPFLPDPPPWSEFYRPPSAPEPSAGPVVECSVGELDEPEILPKPNLARLRRLHRRGGGSA